MILINTGLLREEAEQFQRCSASLAMQAEELAQICRGLELQDPVDESVPLLLDIIEDLNAEKDSIIRMSRAMEQTASLYEHCERKIETNCESGVQGASFSAVDHPVTGFTLLQ